METQVKSKHKLPVLLLIFNRSDNALEALKSIREYAPEHIYIAADGPRASKLGEAELCERVRNEVCSAVDWRCTIHTRFRKVNMGCAKAVYDAVTWFFENEEYGIICEDDVVLHPDFYRLCEEYLPYYKDEERVMLITAQNAVPQLNKADQLVFTNGCFIWGWASWRRAWAKMDMKMSAWPKYPKWKLIKHFGLFYGFMMNHYWNKHYKNINNSTSWATRWKFSCLVNDGLTLSANVNLQRNTGTNTEGAHYSADDEDLYDHVPFGSISWPVSPPKSLEYDFSRLILERKEFYRIKLKGIQKKIMKKFFA